jgi:hypothetical protein
MQTRSFFYLCFWLFFSLNLGGCSTSGPISTIDNPWHILAAVSTDTISSASWQEAPEASGFTQITEGNPLAVHQAFVRCLYDAHNLYFAFRCLQPQAELKATAPPGGEVWNDDCVEIFIAPSAPGTRPADEQYFHLIFNSAGSRFSELGAGGEGSWNGAWKVKTVVTADEWRAEVTIPFTSLGGTGQAPAPFTIWNFQIAHTTTKDSEFSTLFPTIGNYHKRADFGSLVFADKPQNENTLLWHVDQQQVITPRLQHINEMLAGITPLPKSDFAKQLAEQKNAASQIAKQFDAAQQEYSPAMESAFFARLDALEKDTRSLQEKMVLQKAQQMGMENGIAMAPHNSIKDTQLVKPDFLPALNDIGQPITATVTPDQYQAASFVLWTDKAQKNVTVNVSTLKANGSSLPVSTVDVHWVKCWYQSGEDDIVREGNFLVPELLLKNPDLVKVDLINQKNILLPPQGKSVAGSMWGYPGDAATLQPLDEAAAKTATQVWLTIHVPKGTAPGIYHGFVQLQSNGRPLARLPLQITVLDFELAPSMLEHNWYADTGWGEGSADDQNPARVRAEIQDLVRHGVTYVGMVERLKELPTAIEFMKQGGLPTDKLYLLTNFSNLNFDPPITPETAATRAAAWVAAAKAAGVNQVYLYLQDEATGEALKAERPIAEAIHQAGAKTWVACYPEYFPIAGDFLDAPIVSGQLSPALAAKVHAAGGKIFSYGNPQGGIEHPEVYRRNYGLRLWQCGYDGAFDFAWYFSFGPSGPNDNDKNPWDDFLAPHYRQHCMVYPTQTGVVDTIQWEGWREGVDDCRYMATLLREIAKARKEGRATAAVQAAQNWVTSLKSSGEKGLADLDEVRAAMIRHIQACRAAR